MANRSNPTAAPKTAREAAAYEFNKKRDEAVDLLEEYGRASAVYTAPDSTVEQKADAKEAMLEMADDLEMAYLFYKHQCEHRASLGRNPHTDTELGELKHEKGLAWKAWQAAIALRPPPPTAEQILAEAKAREVREKEAKALLRKDKEERMAREREEFASEATARTAEEARKAAERAAAKVAADAKAEQERLARQGGNTNNPARAGQ